METTTTNNNNTKNNNIVSLRRSLLDLVEERCADGTFVAVDVLRELQTEAYLLYETQVIRDLFDQDPFECYYYGESTSSTIAGAGDAAAATDDDDDDEEDHDHENENENDKDEV